jgi:hypothetical protein
VVVLMMLGALAFWPVSDRVAYWIWRRTRYEHARRTADYPLTDPTNFCYPSNTWTRDPGY